MQEDWRKGAGAGFARTGVTPLPQHNTCYQCYVCSVQCKAWIYPGFEDIDRGGYAPYRRKADVVSPFQFPVLVGR